MKPLFTPFFRILHIVSSLAIFLLVFPEPSNAKDHGYNKHSDTKGYSSHKSNRIDDDLRRLYFAQPHHNYSLSFGIGYAGTGYYYGPPDVSYYYEGPGVLFYRHRNVVPREYIVVDGGYHNHSAVVAVQRSLAMRGYTIGPIDGIIGPMTSRAIARYQEEHGLRVTGTINFSLLDSLDID